MRALERERTTTLPVGFQAILVVLCGVALSWLAVNVPLVFVLAGLGALAYCFLFLQRPDLGLLALLLVRPSTDVSIWLMGLASQVTPVANLTPNAALILILLFCGTVYVVARGVPFLSLPGGVLLILFQLVGLVAMLRSESKISSLNEWFAVASTLVAYVLSAHLFRTPQQIQRVVDVLGLSFVVPAIFGLQQVATGSSYRVYGTFTSPPGFALYLMLILIVFAGQFLAHSGMRKFIAMVIVFTSALLLIETFTRSAWGGALAALFVLAILRKRIPLVLVLIAVVVCARMIPSIDARLAEVSQGTSTLSDRQFLWQSTFDEWITTTANSGSDIATAVNRLGGLGPRSQPLLTGRTSYKESQLAHNNYLRIAIEYGVFGLILYLLLILLIGFLAYRAWQQRVDKRIDAVATSVVALTVGYAISGLTDNQFGDTTVGIAYWTLAGMTVAFARLAAQKKTQSPAEGAHRESPLSNTQRSFAERAGVALGE